MPKKVSDHRLDEIVDALRTFEANRDAIEWASQYGRDLAMRVARDKDDDHDGKTTWAISSRIDGLDELAGAINKLAAYAAFHALMEKEEEMDDE